VETSERSNHWPLVRECLSTEKYRREGCLRHHDTGKWKLLSFQSYFVWSMQWLTVSFCGCVSIILEKLTIVYSSSHFYSCTILLSRGWRLCRVGWWPVVKAVHLSFLCATNEIHLINTKYSVLACSAGFSNLNLVLCDYSAFKYSILSDKYRPRQQRKPFVTLLAKAEEEKPSKAAGSTGYPSAWRISMRQTRKAPQKASSKLNLWLASAIETQWKKTYRKAKAKSIRRRNSWRSNGEAGVMAAARHQW